MIEEDPEYGTALTTGRCGHRAIIVPRPSGKSYASGAHLKDSLAHSRADARSWGGDDQSPWDLPSRPGLTARRSLACRKAEPRRQMRLARGMAPSFADGSRDISR